MLDMWVILRGCRRSYVGVSVLLEEAPYAEGCVVSGSVR